jgi:hypothetical protein
MSNTSDSSKEEILNKYLQEDLSEGYFPPAIKAMQEYADQEVVKALEKQAADFDEILNNTANIARNAKNGRP